MKSRFFDFFRLIRLKNLLIIALTQIIVKFSFIDVLFPHDFPSDTHFLLLVFITVFIAAAGYIINDIYDVETDKINKPEELIIGKSISSRVAISWYYFLNTLAILMGTYLSFKIGEPYLVFIFIFFVFSLWRYSKTYKNSFLIGNILVSFITSLSVLNVFLFDVFPIHERCDRVILFVIIFYTIFSFLISLSREIIKDLEDLEGDKIQNSNNLVINLGIVKSRNIVTFINSLLFIIIIVYLFSLL